MRGAGLWESRRREGEAGDTEGERGRKERRREEREGESVKDVFNHGRVASLPARHEESPYKCLLLVLDCGGPGETERGERGRERA